MTAKRQGAWPSVERDPLAAQRPHALGVPVGLLLQDADQAEVGVAEGRADHPPGRRPRPGQRDGRARAISSASHRFPDVLVIGLGPAGLSAAIAAAKAGKSRVRRRRERARLEAAAGSRQGGRRAPGRRGAPRAPDRARAVAYGDRHLRGPRGRRGRPGPAATWCIRARSSSRRARSSRTSCSRATRCPASSSAAAPRASSASHGIRVGENAVVVGGTHEAAAHAAALRSREPRSRPSCCLRAPTTPASRAPASCAARAGGARAQGRQRRHGRARGGRQRADHVRRARALRRLHAAGEPAAPDLRRAGLGCRRHRRARPARAGHRRRGARSAPQPQAAQRIELPALGAKTAGLRLRRLRLHLLRRHGRRDRALGQGGLPLDGAAQALHDGDDGRLPGTALPRPAARAERALLARRRRASQRAPRPRAHRRGRCGSRRPSRATATISSGAPACTTPTSRLGARFLWAGPVEARRALRQARRARPDRDPSRVPGRARGRRGSSTSARSASSS